MQSNGSQRADRQGSRRSWVGALTSRRGSVSMEICRALRCQSSRSLISCSAERRQQRGREERVFDSPIFSSLPTCHLAETTPDLYLPDSLLTCIFSLPILPLHPFSTHLPSPPHIIPPYSTGSRSYRFPRRSHSSPSRIHGRHLSINR